MAPPPIAETGRRTAPSSDRPPFTVFDLQAPVNRRRALRRVPRLTVDALRMLMDATRRHVFTTVGLQVAAGFGAAAQLLVAREILNDFVAIDEGASASAVQTDFALLVGILLVMGIITSLVAHQQQLLVELVARKAFLRIIDVATTVDLETMETPEFHDQLERARTSAPPSR